MKHPVTAVPLAPRKAKQRGSLLFDILVGAAILSVVIIGAIVITNNRADASEQSRAYAIIAEQLPSALTGVYYDNRRNYTDVVQADRDRVLVNRGVSPVMPWGDAWLISAAGTAGPNPTVSVTFPTDGARNAANMCANLSAQVQSLLNDAAASPGGVQTITATNCDGTEVVVTYGRPR